jgi:hypothetical protein
VPDTIDEIESLANGTINSNAKPTEITAPIDK